MFLFLPAEMFLDISNAYDNLKFLKTRGGSFMFFLAVSIP
jgi:hypothetical protein